MTPAITLLKKAGIAYQVLSYTHSADADSYGQEAVLLLGLHPREVFKTLLASTDKGELLVAIVPVSGSLDLKALAHAAESRKCEMADPAAAQRATGYPLGGISPLGQKMRLRSFIDSTATALPTMHVSGGRRGLEIALAPADLAALTDARLVAIGRPRDE